MNGYMRCGVNVLEALTACHLFVVFMPITNAPRSFAYPQSRPRSLLLASLTTKPHRDDHNGRTGQNVNLV